MTSLAFRAIYRTIELSQGWNGRIISNQLYFSKLLLRFIVAWLLMDNLIDILDGAMVPIAMYTINLGHPGMLLGSFKNKPLDANGRA